MKSDNKLEPEAPKLLKQIKWVLLNWRQNWLIILIAIVIISAYPLYNLIRDSSIFQSHLGSFEVTFINSSNDTVSVYSPGEFYLEGPETPGNNKEISAGVLELEFDENQYKLLIPPSESRSISGRLLNEERLFQYLDAGEYFGKIVFSASPKPIRTEVLFREKTFRRGIRVLIE